MIDKIISTLVGGVDIKGTVTSIFGDKAEAKKLDSELDKLAEELKGKLESEMLKFADNNSERFTELQREALKAQTASNNAVADIIKSDNASDSKFVKCARPFVIYMGAIAFFLECFGVRLILLNKLGVDQAIIDSSSVTLGSFIEVWKTYGTAYVVSRTLEKTTGNGLLATVKNVIPKKK